MKFLQFLSKKLVLKLSEFNIPVITGLFELQTHTQCSVNDRRDEITRKNPLDLPLKPEKITGGEKYKPDSCPLCVFCSSIRPL